MVRVTNRNTGRSVVVRINDPGPFVRGRVIDLTAAAAHQLGFSGLAPVSLSVVRAAAAFQMRVCVGKRFAAPVFARAFTAESFCAPRSFHPPVPLWALVSDVVGLDPEAVLLATPFQARASVKSGDN